MPRDLTHRSIQIYGGCTAQGARRAAAALVGQPQPGHAVVEARRTGAAQVVREAR